MSFLCWKGIAFDPLLLLFPRQCCLAPPSNVAWVVSSVHHELWLAVVVAVRFFFVITHLLFFFSPLFAFTRGLRRPPL